MKLNEAIQVRMAQIVGAENYDRISRTSASAKWPGGILYSFAPTEDQAAEIEEKFALHLSIVASQISGVAVEFVQVLPTALQDQTS